jgi:hypothetical protein
MIVVRTDVIGSIVMRLVYRPTNTAVGVDNFSIVVKSPDLPTPVVRAVGTDALWADNRYERVLQETKQIMRG